MCVGWVGGLHCLLHKFVCVYVFVCMCILVHMEKDRVKGYCNLFPYSEVKSCQKFQFKYGFLDIYL
jgi:hypothetical protein